MRLLAAVLVAAALAVPARAQASAEGGALEVARVLLAAGDSAGAYRAVQDALPPRTLDADLRRLQVRLRLAGFGTDGMPAAMRATHVGEAARYLLRSAPGDTLALRVLVDAGVLEAARWHDRVWVTEINPDDAAFRDGAEIRARLAQSVFDLDQRHHLAPVLEQGFYARRAHRAAVGYLETWFAADPASVPAHRAAVTLAVLTRNWDGALALARQMQDRTGDPRADLYAGLALARLHDLDAADAAFRDALEALPPHERVRYDDVRPLLRFDDRAAYDANPDSARAAFWAAADPRLLTPVNERRVEHVARVVEADLVLGAGPAGSIRPGATRGADTPDGQTLIRYGRPLRSRSYRVDGLDPRAFRVWDYDGFRFVFEDLSFNGEFRRFSPPGAAGTHKDDYVIQDREMQRDDPSQTQLAPERVLEVPVLVSRFRSGRGLEAVVAWGIAADLGGAVETGVFVLEGAEVTDRVTGVRPVGPVLEGEGGPVRPAAATVALEGGAVRVEVEGDGGRARGSATVPVEPLPGGFGVSDVLLALAVDPGSGPGQALEGQGPVVRNGIGLVPAPRAAFSTNDPVGVYLEAYGLGLEDGRTRYSVEAALRPVARRGGLLGRILGRGQGPGVSVRSEGAGSSADEPLAFSIRIRDQPPGRYTLRVEVRDEVTGRAASAEREVVLE